ncbi:hypothetical protein BKA61DRAFT_147672 [Leptodontidium sp. MPI-SDFR-AT-0119]|nr:hypothetical protein BKA61DRAFT_147672 [Leptodontidium sp. MPI-SDFR-AT-0119]
MPTQDELLVNADLPIYEDISKGAELKTRNPKRDPLQRQIITDRGRNSTEFKATVRLAACVHGFLDSSVEHPTPASLIILEYSLNSLHEKHKYRSLFTELVFSCADEEADPELTPQIIAFAPFEKAVSAHGIDVEETKSTALKLDSLTINAPAGLGVTIGGPLGKEAEKKYTRRYAQLLQASRHVSKDDVPGYDTIWWSMQQNDELKDGIPTTFRIAVLLQRQNRERFTADFRMKLDAGTWYNTLRRWEDFWGLCETDDPIIFDPQLEPRGEVEGIMGTNLGQLRDGSDLKTLGQFWNPLEQN